MSANGVLNLTVSHYVQVTTLVLYPTYAAIWGRINWISWVLVGMATLWGIWIYLRTSGRIRAWSVIRDEVGIQDAIQKELDAILADNVPPERIPKKAYLKALHARLKDQQKEIIKLRKQQEKT